MGISTPKKPFNLAEFLNESGKPRPTRKTFRYRGSASTEDDSGETPKAEAGSAEE